MKSLLKIVIIFGLGAAAGTLIVYNLGLNAKNIKDSDVFFAEAQSGKMTVEAKGTAVWLLDDHNPLDPEVYGTPEDPHGTTTLPFPIPLVNREITEDGSSFTVSAPSAFALERTKITGEIRIEAEDLTPVGTPDSKDKATAEATFKGPNGEDFKVILRRLIPTSLRGIYPRMAADYSYGGVAMNHFYHGGGIVGTDKLSPEFSYLSIWGAGDVYKDGELIDTDRLILIMISERAREKEFLAGLRKPTQVENLVVHFVLVEVKIFEDNSMMVSNIPTGVFDENGNEQGFFHINYLENIKITGSKFF